MPLQNLKNPLPTVRILMAYPLKIISVDYYNPSSLLRQNTFCDISAYNKNMPEQKKEKPRTEIDRLLQDYLNYLEIEKNRSPRTSENYKHYLDEFLRILPPEKISQLYKAEKEFNDEMLRQLSERSIRAGN